MATDDLADHAVQGLSRCVGPELGTEVIAIVQIGRDMAPFPRYDAAKIGECGGLLAFHLTGIVGIVCSDGGLPFVRRATVGKKDALHRARARHRKEKCGKNAARQASEHIDGAYGYTAAS